MAYQILIVEEDPEYRTELKKSLEQTGFAVVEAESAKQALELLEKKQFDLAITELMLEHSDSGFSLCYHLKKNNPKMPVILLSSSASEMGIEFTMESVGERAWIQADMLLNKPIRFEQLLYGVQKHLGCLASPH